MNKKEEIYEKIGNLRKDFELEIDKILIAIDENEVIQKKKKERWKPKEDEIYWFVDADGDITDVPWYNRHYHEWCYNQRNCFKTRQEVGEYKRYLEIEAQIRYIADDLNEGRKVKWGENQWHYKIWYDHEDGEISDVKTKDVQTPEIYCLNEKFRNICVERIGKEDLKFYLTYER